MAGIPCPHGRLACAYCKPPRARPPRHCVSCSRTIARDDAHLCSVCVERGVEAPSLFDPLTDRP